MQALRCLRPVALPLLQMNQTAAAHNARMAAFTAPRRALHATHFSQNIMNRMRSAIQNSRDNEEEKREKGAFEAQLKYLTDRERKIDGNVYIETLVDLKAAAGLSGFREHLPWVQNNPALTDMKLEDSILRTMTPDERKRPDRVPISAKKRVARSLNVPLSQVEGLLERIVAMRLTQHWIIKRMDADLPIPKSTAEMQVMLAVPGSGLKRPRSYQKFPNPGVKEKMRRKR